jgi:hypothetical protein
MFTRAVYRPADCMLTIYGDKTYEIDDLLTERDATAYVHAIDPECPVEVETSTVFGLLKSIGPF